MMKVGAFMRIVVISDSHGHGSIVDRIIRRESSADIVGTKIFITHGHTLGVKNSTAVLSAAARQSDCKIALYGHTHVPNIKYEDGLYIVNPGSCARSRDGGNSYAVIDIRDNGILPTIIRI